MTAPTTTTVSHGLARATAQLASVSPTASLDAQLLLSAVLSVSRTWLFTWSDTTLSDEAERAFFALVAKRYEGMPVAYLLGTREFFGRTFTVTQATLIPRPETELLVETALAKMPDKAGQVLDLGTGTGAVGLTLALERPQWQVTCVDVSEAALSVAQQNQANLQVRNVQWQVSDWFTSVPAQRYDVIVSNPPYIPEDDVHLQQGDVRFEPASALVSGEHGLGDIRRIVAQAPGYVSEGGWLMIEHGYNQGESVRLAFAASGWVSVQTLPDLAGMERVTLGQKPLVISQGATDAVG